MKAELTESFPDADHWGRDLALVIPQLYTTTCMEWYPLLVSLGLPVLSASTHRCDLLLWAIPVWYTGFSSDLGLHGSKSKQEHFCAPVLGDNYIDQVLSLQEADTVSKSMPLTSESAGTEKRMC